MVDADEQQRKVRNIIRWQRIGCIVVKISETLNVSLKEALDLFYKSETCPDRRQHDNKKTPGNTPSLKPHHHKKGD